MGSKKAILILGLMAMVLLISISSEVAARDLAEASSNPKEVVKEKNEVGNAKYGGRPLVCGYGPCNPPGGGGYPPGGGGYPPGGGGYPPGGGGYPPGGGGYPPGGGGYPPGGGGYPPGGGGYPPGGGGYPPPNTYCRYGCCSSYGTTCFRCCSYAGEAVAVETQDKTRN